MILTPTEMLTAIKKKPNAAVLAAAQKDSKKLTAHITGQGSSDLLSKISGLENEEQLKLRREYARSNKDIFARIHRPEDKIFSAKGGSNYYNLPESKQKDFIVKLNNVYHGFSVRAWVESFAKQYFHIDPMGLVFIEVGFETAYPTYKSTNSIYDYKLKGREVEYVIFNTDEQNIYRIVDDQFDYLVKYENETLTTIQDKTYPNYFGKVPAIVISDLIGQNTECYTSPDWEIIEIADEFLRECSVKSIYKLKHGFPKSWQYAGVCETCKGTGFLEGKECPTCKTSGKSVFKDSSQTINIPIPENGQPTITPDVAGYISPDIEGWSKMTEELTALENIMNSTYWGIKDKVKTQGLGNEKTATEIIDDMQPLNDRLFRFSKWAEGVESFITNLLGEFYYNSTYKGSSINYGRRYMIEGPDTIWKKYEDARKNGNPVSVLDELLTEYYYSKFNSNSIELNKYLKLMKVEPFIHLSISEAKNVITSQDDYNRKLYFSEWLNQLPPNDVMLKQANELSASLSEYVKAKKIEEPIIK